ncbi:MAG: hypothetical protein QM520_06650, partial [Gammaproteobacteria bacterium]|nr:hypothetical protein [Gammaproteobacteria bacterium]
DLTPLVVDISDKNVKTEAKTYQNGRGGKGSVAGSQEILFVCSPKKKHIVSNIHKQQLVNEGFSILEEVTRK